MSSTASILEPTGETRVVVLPDEEGARLEFMRAVIGGYLEVVPLHGNRYLVFDEDGKGKALPPNDFATWLAHDSESIRSDDYIAGTALVVNRAAIS